MGAKKSSRSIFFLPLKPARVVEHMLLLYACWKCQSDLLTLCCWNPMKIWSTSNALKPCWQKEKSSQKTVYNFTNVLLILNTVTICHRKELQKQSRTSLCAVFRNYLYFLFCISSVNSHWNLSTVRIERKAGCRKWWVFYEC